MNFGIGIDIVASDRFESWLSHSSAQLSKVFSDSEIKEFLSESSAEYKKQFLASRFAAKEAFYKALCHFLSQFKINMQNITFDRVRTLVSTNKDFYGIPFLTVKWDELEDLTDFHFKLNMQLSISHEKNIAVAIVFINSLN